MYLLVSLPLLLIQGSNPYADLFEAAHVLLAVLCLFRLAESNAQTERGTWFTLAGFTLGLLLFTKNEASVLYSPILLLQLAWVLCAQRKNNPLQTKQIAKFLALAGFIAAPWLLFKWIHGLSFGNAKSITHLAVAFHPQVIDAIWFHLSHEPNWLLLPLVLPLTLLAAGKRAFRLPESVLTIFVLVAVTAQFLIFLFTPLATEAILQTGLSRGLLHIAPVAMLLVIVLIQKLWEER